MKSTFKFLALLLAFATLLSVLSGCGKYDKKAIIYYNVTEIPKNIDPQSASSNAELLMVRNLFEGLMRLDSDGNLTTGIAESYTENNLIYTFKISESACWSNGEQVTANDFVFAFRRAVDPNTGCPFATKFYSILNADEIINNGVDPSYLGVKAVNDFTLQVTLDYNDENFLYNLSTSAFMPCNEEFFINCKGKYGLSKSTILTNGSYTLGKWATEDFAARLYKSENYLGKFQASNGGIFLSKNEKADGLELLKSSSVDISKIDMSKTLFSDIPADSLKTVQFENICWVMKLSDSLPFELRKAFISSIDRNLYAGDLGEGFSISYSFFPSSILKDDVNRAGIPVYSVETAKENFNNAVNKNYSGKLPKMSVIYYADNGIKKSINDIVGHWQQNLGAYLNIEPADNIIKLQKNLVTEGDDISVFPVYITDRDINSYVTQYGISANSLSPDTLQRKMTEDYTLIPLAFQNSVYAYSTDLIEVNASIGNGIFDFAYFKKHR